MNKISFITNMILDTLKKLLVRFKNAKVWITIFCEYF